MGKRFSKLGLLCALSLIMFLVESLFPPMFIPGAKLGLGNIFIMLALIYFSYPEALLLVIAKSLLAGIMAGNPFSILFSFAAGICSLTVTYLLLKFFGKNLSVVSVAALSACTHNLTQLCVFAIINGSKNVFFYAPYLAVLGLLSGIITGLVVFLILKRDFAFLKA